MTPSIFLVGFMGSGKSAVGEELATQLGWELVDLDEVIVESAGCSIPDIFAEEGEAGFRTREGQALEAALSGAQQVVSCGGGIVTQPDALNSLVQTPGAVCLEVSPEEVWKRIGQDPNRPLLQGDDPQRTIRELLEKREPLYAQFPVRISTDGFRTSEVVDRILSELRKGSFFEDGRTF